MSVVRMEEHKVKWTTFLTKARNRSTFCHCSINAVIFLCVEHECFCHVGTKLQLKRHLPINGNHFSSFLLGLVVVQTVSGRCATLCCGLKPQNREISKFYRSSVDISCDIFQLCGSHQILHAPSIVHQEVLGVYREKL